jgi:hypothetical protein
VVKNANLQSKHKSRGGVLCTLVAGRGSASDRGEVGC